MKGENSIYDAYCAKQCLSGGINTHAGLLKHRRSKLLAFLGSHLNSVLTSSGYLVPWPRSGVPNGFDIASGLCRLTELQLSLQADLYKVADSEWSYPGTQVRAVHFLINRLDVPAVREMLFAEVARLVTMEMLAKMMTDYLHAVADTRKGAPAFVEPPELAMGTENQRYEYIRRALTIPSAEWSVPRAWVRCIDLASSTLCDIYNSLRELEPLRTGWKNKDRFTLGIVDALAR